MLHPVKDNEISRDGVSIAFLVEFAAECRRTLADAEITTTADIWVRKIKPATESAKISYVELLQLTGCAHYVGQATVFFSHAWTYQFQLVVETLAGWCEREGIDARVSFVWFDTFTVNQHTCITDFAHWSQGFQHTIRSIGRVVVFLQPWDKAVWLSRAWCMYE
jgi:hypothetical protein